MSDLPAPSCSAKGKGPILDPGLCRCCRSIKKCRLLTSEYDWMGKQEVYSDMFVDCFGLMLSHLDGENKDTCICATCVMRLRDASAFRQQVLLCEQAFISAKLDTKDEDSKIKTSLVKEEPARNSDTEDDRDADPDYKDESKSRVSLEVKDEPARVVDSDMDDRDADPDYTEKLKPNIEVAIERPLKERMKTRKTKKAGQRSLITEMVRMKGKLAKMLEKPEREPKPIRKTPKPSQPPKKSKAEMDNEDMIYNNAVTIAHYSYVCPFQNRISYYYCFYCKDQFTNPTELREHTLTHNPQSLFESSMEYKKIPKIDITRIDCRLCDEKITDLPTFKKHISERHNKKIYPVTNEFLTFKLELESVTCTECNMSFPYFDFLKKHMTEHFGNYICHQCGACFLEQNSLRSHIKSHNKVDLNFPCEVCGKNLKSKYSRYLHILHVHEKKPSVNCYKCDAVFFSYALRNRHLTEVHGDKRTFPCQLCDKVYNRRKSLMEHNRRNHLKVYRHQCELCDRRFYLPSRLKEHMATHTGERNFRCEYCDKSFAQPQSLHEHARTHERRRDAPYDEYA